MSKDKKAKKKVNLENVDLRKLPKDERPRPSTGQHGVKLELAWEDMSGDEQKVVERLYILDGTGTVAEVAQAGFGRDNPKLRARNAIRRLVRGDWIMRKERAQYGLSNSGSRRFNSAMGGKMPKITPLEKAKVKETKAKGASSPKKKAKRKPAKAADGKAAPARPKLVAVNGGSVAGEPEI